jgi:hypothetical protein
MRLAWLLVLAGCAPSAPPSQRCYEGRSSEAAASELRAELGRDGWDEVVVERHDLVAGRWLVRGHRAEVRLAGKLDEGVSGCSGSRLDLRAVTVPSAGASTAGPKGPRTR